MYSDELYHYGVLGMKWGVHRVRRAFGKSKDYRARSAKYAYEQDKYLEKANRTRDLSKRNRFNVKSKSYGQMSTKYRLKADYYEAKGEKYLGKFEHKIRKKMKTMSPMEFEKGYDFCNLFLNEMQSSPDRAYNRNRIQEQESFASNTRTQKRVNKYKNDVEYYNSGYGDGKVSYSQSKLATNPEVKKMYSRLGKARAKYFESFKLAREFNNNPDLVARYQEKAAREAWRKHGRNDPQLLDNFIDAYKNDDQDHGSGNSFYMYLRDKNIDPIEWQDKTIRAEEKYKNECSKVAKKIVGDIGDYPVGKVVGDDTTVKDAVEFALEYMTDAERFRTGRFNRE